MVSSNVTNRIELVQKRFVEIQPALRAGVMAGITHDTGLYPVADPKITAVLVAFGVNYL